MKTTVDIDETVVDTLREELGTRTKRETIDCALRFFLGRVQHGDAVAVRPLSTGALSACRMERLARSSGPWNCPRPMVALPPA